MKFAYLTVDDIPTRNTPKIIDYLNSKNIQPLMFCWGQRLEKFPEQAVYALKHGAILQNHTYSHPFASKLTFDEMTGEIAKNEELLQEIYRKAGVNRPYKLFRFPYGDQGGENRSKLQKWLKENGFSHLDDSAFPDDEYEKCGCPKDQKQNTDVLWTFDFAEYNLRPGNNFAFSDVVKRVESAFPLAVESTASIPKLELSSGIVLIHDHEETENMHNGYFPEQIEMLLSRGIRFVKPKVL